MARKCTYKRRQMSEINVVPYIDVMLVLLVIFMITAPLLSQGVKVDLPQAPSKPLPHEQQEPLVVDVDAAGNYYLNVGESNDQPVDPDVLVQRVAAVLKYRPETPVYVKGDRQANYGVVVTAMALLQEAGVANVGLVTEPAPERR